MKTPGESLGTEEEYVSGYGTFEENSAIYASLSGELKVDLERKMSIRGAMASPMRIKPGMVVYGRVEEIFDPIALVRIHPITTGMERQVRDQFYCVLHVSRVKMGYVRNIREELRIGDIIKAVVDEIKNMDIHLSTKRGGMGVIKAYCTKCRFPLKQEGQELVCKNCGEKEQRKLGSPYRNI
ncbi:MAG: exosome complex RNA-binding protein Csl4 [Candidatus Micrarchaeota archaeon]